MVQNIYTSIQPPAQAGDQVLYYDLLEGNSKKSGKCLEPRVDIVGFKSFWAQEHLNVYLLAY